MNEDADRADEDQNDPDGYDGGGGNNNDNNGDAGADYMRDLQDYVGSGVDLTGGFQTVGDLDRQRYGGGRGDGFGGFDFTRAAFEDPQGFSRFVAPGGYGFNSFREAAFGPGGGFGSAVGYGLNNLGRSIASGLQDVANNPGAFAANVLGGLTPLGGVNSLFGLSNTMLGTSLPTFGGLYNAGKRELARGEYGIFGSAQPGAVPEEQQVASIPDTFDPGYPRIGGEGKSDPFFSAATQQSAPSLNPTPTLGLPTKDWGMLTFNPATNQFEYPGA